MIRFHVAYFIYTELGLRKVNVIVYVRVTIKGVSSNILRQFALSPAINESDEVGKRVRAGASGGRPRKKTLFTAPFINRRYCPLSKKYITMSCFRWTVAVIARFSVHHS